MDKQAASEPQNLHTQHIQNPVYSPQSNDASTAQNSNSIPHSKSDENPELLLLRDAAQKGDLQAIASLVSQAIAPQSTTVEATMQHGVTLWLKIYPSATLNPQSCIQSVIDVLNHIQPDKVSSVRISEIGANKKRQVWNRFLVLKNGKFVDNTTSINISTGILAILMIGLFGYCVLPKGSSTSPNRHNIYSATFPEKWMLTVDSGELICEAPSIVIFIAPDGTKYAVNGTAKSRGYADIQPIWKDDPEIPGTKVNIGPLISEGLKLCK